MSIPELLAMANDAAHDAVLATRTCFSLEGDAIVLKRDETAKLVRASRQLSCAATELENRAMGLPEPKSGD